MEHSFTLHFISAWVVVSTDQPHFMIYENDSFQCTATPYLRPLTPAKVFVVIRETKTCRSRYKESRKRLTALMLVLRKGQVPMNFFLQGLG